MKALITGASGGLGAAIARELAAAGWSLALSGRDAGVLEALANELTEGFGVECLPFVADLCDPASVRALTDHFEERELNALILAGAQYNHSAAAAQSAESFMALTQSNVVQTGHLIRWAMTRLEPCDKLLVVGSMGATMPAPYNASYSASKAWLHQYVRSIQAEAEGPSVTLAIPGGMKTPMLTTSPAYRRLQGIPILRSSIQTPRAAARQMVAAMMSGRRQVVTGFWNRCLYLASRVLPGSLLGAALRWIYRG